MKKIRFLLISLVAGISAVSCDKADLRPAPGPIGGEPVQMPVSIAPAAFSTVFDGFTKTTGELATKDDARIHDLWAIQYDGAGKLVGVPYYTDQIPAATAGATGVDSTYGMTLMLTSSTDAAGKVYLIANTHTPGLFHEDNIAAEDDLKAMAQHLTGEYKPEAGTGIPMLGLYTGAVNSSATLGNVEMKRLVAKVILRYKSSLPGFDFTAVRLRNVAADIRYCPEPASGSDFPAISDGSHIDYPAEDLTQAGTDGDYKTFVWYVPENWRKATAPVPAAGDRTPDKTDGKATCIEIAGMLREGDRCRKGTLNVLLGDLGSGGKAYDNFDVKRNAAYTVTVDLKGLNEGDYRLTVESFDMSNCAMLQPAAEAGKARDSVTFDIRKLTNGWQTTMPALGADAELRVELLWTDNAALASQLKVNLDKVNGLLAVKSEGAAEGNAVIALYDKAAAGSGEILWSWHVWVTGYNPNKLDGGTAALGVAPRSANTAIPVVGGQVHTYGTEFQKVNGTSRVIMDRNLGATKTYYAAPAANDATADQAFGMFYQWGRKDPFPRANGATIDANTATASTIKIYGADGITERPEDANGYKKVNITGVIGSESNTLSYSVKNPLAFIYNSGNGSDWKFNWYTTVVANQNDALWGDGAQKSVYDPCPKGWRIAPVGTWDDFTREVEIPAKGTFPYYSEGVIGEAYGVGSYKASNGRLYNNMAWYPSTGNLSYLDGSKVSTGKDGYSWSSTVINSNGRTLGFHGTWLTPRYNDYRAYGFPVRCIQYVE